MKTPVLLLTYNRPFEFGETLKSLASCDHCNEYELYINIDAPNVFKDDDATKQKEIKGIINDYKRSFLNLHFLQHKYHKGLADSVIDSVTDIINKYGRIIVIEDDFVLSHDCLDYLEEALDYYENESSIWSVTAYSAPLSKLNNYKKDVYLTYRPCSWVWGSWATRWNSVDWNLEEYCINGMNRESLTKLTRGGYDLPEMMMNQLLGLYDSWAIRWCYAAAKQNMMTVYPTYNRVHHIGWGGTHVKAPFPQMELKKKYNKTVWGMEYNKEIAREYRSYNGLNYNNWRKYVARGRYSHPDKFETMFYIMNLWKIISLSGHNISEYFVNRNIHEVAIYGKGKIGVLLEQELCESPIKVLYFIDKNITIEGEKCMIPDRKLPPCECIVITTVLETNQIKDLLYKKGFKTVKTMIEVLRDT